MKFPKTSKSNGSFPVGLAVGSLVALFIGFALSLVTTLLVENEVVPLSSMHTFSIVIHVISVFAGALTAQIIGKQKPAILAIATAGVYITLLFCGALLFFSGSIQGILWGIMSSMVGAAGACILFLKPFKRNKPRIKTRYR